MSRQERKNMIEFIEKVKELKRETLIYMTDADIEHIYNAVYHSHEETVE